MSVEGKDRVDSSTEDASPSLRPRGLLSDEEVVARVRAGETDLFELILRRYNQRLYRVARAIVADDQDAHDVLQTTYLRAYSHLAQFERRSSFATWLTRIAINEARTRGQLRRFQSLSDGSDGSDGSAAEASADRMPEVAPSAEHEAELGEMRHLLESAIEQLPESFRTVFVLREVEQMTTEEAAELLELPENTVKTRLYRARHLLRRLISAQLGPAAALVFEFGGARCDQLVATVMAKIAQGKE